MSTVQALLVAAGRRLRDAGIDAGDARPLLAHVLGVARDRLVLMGPDEVSDDQAARFEGYVTQRLGHRPVSKIIGERLFWGRSFAVTDDVLDPRPETESLIAAALNLSAPQRIIDLGTGTGCIPLTLLAELPDATGVACDISDAALSVAAQNAAALGLATRIQFLQSDWFAEVTGQFDLITSNPPYISDAEMRDLSPEVFHHDPHLALTPGGDGLSPYVVLAAGARDHLTPGGHILVEIGWRQGADVARIFRDAGLIDVAILPDMDGRDRVVTGRNPS
ncbi:peptide chain release factor N(5)-glutamine methyltransferase [Thalassovita mediterranea]|jgi:release factor glutamine methyltransferase|uniref:Release factor glutamine methyltransferase n=1 Tax=Thalassovita mediterranea TaxID=340021 RepID=A0A0P1GLK1_9RHOB|nr:peptide chain release factor N(5)-glutamine methyltransferase [Thalassovita mediterranea]CUH83237.1 Release factor glutamine methyltransferase [Thalassovita mediterranea]SIS33581.1 [protein release factor]-glutamine N5-methyltransferase [Thalassovita mediterranea]